MPIPFLLLAAAVTTQTQTVDGFTDKEWLALLGVIILVLQFLYRLWDKRDNAAIIDALRTQHEMTMEVISKSVESFTPHVELNKRTFGIVKELKTIHDVRDTDGRPMIYTPREFMETQRELVALTHTVATTQKFIGNIFERHERQCRLQHDELKIKLKE